MYGPGLESVPLSSASPDRRHFANHRRTEAEIEEVGESLEQPPDANQAVSADSEDAKKDRDAGEIDSTLIVASISGWQKDSASEVCSRITDII